jgi:hypothetical protein
MQETLEQFWTMTGQPGTLTSDFKETLTLVNKKSLRSQEVNAYR